MLADREIREIQQIARRNDMTVAEWVRQALRTALRQQPRKDARLKLALVRAAANHAFPTADIDQILKEIEQGHLSQAPK